MSWRAFNIQMRPETREQLDYLRKTYGLSGAKIVERALAYLSQPVIGRRILGQPVGRRERDHAEAR